MAERRSGRRQGTRKLPTMVCPGCGSPIPAGARFCPSCGHRAAAHGDERRVVTVVFADVVGFTSLSETRDPEQVKHIVDRCFVGLADDVVRFGGRVDKIIGDAMVALFGAPVAHEDDPERAVRAALAMQDSMMSSFDDHGGVVRLRIGVNTGEVLVGAMQAGGDYTAMGDVVNTASRLQSAAEPGEVLVGAATHGATRRVIQYSERGVVPAKGREAPVEAWRAIAPVTVPGSRDRPEGVPLVGRDSELTLLSDAAATALDHGRGALVLLQGEAGSGKTRLASELTARLVVERNALVLEGRCVPYGEANAWFPVAEAFRPMCGVQAGDPLDDTVKRVTAAVRGLLGPDAEASDVERTSGGLLQVFGFDEARHDWDPDRAHDEVVRAMARIFAVLVAERPVVVKLSDIHWADTVVLDLFSVLLGRLGRAPFVLVATARRSLLDRWSPPVGRFDTVSLNVDVLDREATEALLDHLLDAAGRTPLSGESRHVLLERSGGNPMFLAELVSALHDEPVPSTVGAAALGDLPDTLRGLVAARLDRLGPRARAVVDDASVLGRRGLVFHLHEMARLVHGVDGIDEELAELAARDLIRVDGDHWEFHNDLTREVAYHTLTKVDRAQRHLGVAKWIEAHHHGVWSDGQVDLLAHHYGLAAELLADVGAVGQLAGGLRDQALHWVDEAAGRAERLHLLHSVVRLAGQGLALAGTGPSPRRLALLLRRARAEVELRQVAQSLGDLEEADTVAAALGDASARAAVLVVRGDLQQKAGDFEGAMATLDRAVASYEAAGDPEGRAEALRTRALSELMAGLLEPAEASASEALAAFSAADRPRGQAWALQNLAWIALMRGRSAEADEYVVRSLEVFDRLGDAGGAAWAKGVQGFVRFEAGDFAGAEERQREVLDEVRNRGDGWAVGMMLLLGSGLCLWSGRTEEAMAQGQEGMAIFRALSDRFGQSRIAWPLGRALVMRGRVAEGISLLDDVRLEALSHTVEDRVITSVALAATEVHLGRPERALEALAAISDCEDGDDMALARVDRLTAMAMAMLQLGRVEDAADRVEVAVAMAKQDGTERLAALATRALVVAAGRDADPARVEALAAEVAADDRSSYLDRTLAGIAAGLAAARAGDASASAGRFLALRAMVDDTGDLLTQAIVRLAEGRALEALGDADSLDATADAWARLHGLGIDGSGWVRAFDRGLGSTATNDPVPA